MTSARPPAPSPVLGTDALAQRYFSNPNLPAPPLASLQLQPSGLTDAARHYAMQQQQQQQQRAMSDATAAMSPEQAHTQHLLAMARQAQLRQNMTTEQQHQQQQMMLMQQQQQQQQQQSFRAQADGGPNFDAMQAYQRQRMAQQQMLHNAGPVPVASSSSPAAPYSQQAPVPPAGAPQQVRQPPPALHVQIPQTQGAYAAAAIPPPISRQEEQQQHLPIASTSALPDAPARPARQGLPEAPFLTHRTPMKRGEKLAQFNDVQKGKLPEWIARDLQYTHVLARDQNAMKRQFAEISEIWARSDDWLGDPAQISRERKLRIKWPADRRRERQAGKRGPRGEFKFTKAQLRHIADEDELLCPIRLDIEVQGLKLRDTFTWNLRDPLITPELFANTLCEDMKLPPSLFAQQIASAINEQLEDSRRVSYEGNVYGDHEADQGLDAEEWKWWQAAQSKHVGETQNLADIVVPVCADEELRILVKLDITQDCIQLLDQFEWDISDPKNVPEDFAELYAADLGLAGDYKTAIAHSIREQIDAFVKSLGLIDHRPGSQVTHDELRYAFLAPVTEPYRHDPSEFTPRLDQLLPDELDRNEKEREKEIRRNRRQTRGRRNVVSLPDRDPLKTARTLLPAPGATMARSDYDAELETYVYHASAIARPPVANNGEISARATRRARRAGIDPTREASIISDAYPDLDDLRPSKLRRRKRGARDSEALRDTLSPPPNMSNGASPRPSRQTELGAIAAKKKVKAPTLTSNLHPHIIDGVWHCGNCGAPDGAALGRRKGPDGQISLCGACGKHYNRFRRHRETDYSTSSDYHLSLLSKPELDRLRAKQAKTAVPTLPTPMPYQQEKPPARNAAPPTIVPKREPKREVSEPLTPLPVEEPEITPTASSRAVNGMPSVPASTASSSRGSSVLDTDEEGAKKAQSKQAASHKPDHSPHLQPYAPSSSSVGSSRSASPKTALHIKPAQIEKPMPSLITEDAPPVWMLAAAAELRAAKPDDRFDIIPRPKPPDPLAPREWRLKCLDCPGKLYVPGPGESLANFEVHLKNRVHRLNVGTRVSGHPSI
ncbi:uncharacterized protein L969DRAFT_567229 [Mixia osmundae IAM 14324]|uniref:uncharacterized protein n=1 Tax=Mixia osmundae (strain CBS 9802 / IAM 14324 / JCM 22182 / KY 12970) TaxID=764103 RepID=UPI0004A5540E|nr:uncharacterized protein L969DRAFT_567229 [Mixia osmundae IAM 14324]KEI38081.1 hypothetical protein L969DRAFT_567229 [Mixia osmundae IAM 14324]